MSQHARHDPPTTFTAQHYAALAAELQLFDNRTLKRGRRYFDQRRVLAASIEPPLISGMVFGSGEYETELAWKPSAQSWSYGFGRSLTKDDLSYLLQEA